MSIKGLALAALGGVAAAAVITNFLGTENGKRFLDSAKGSLNDLAHKATDLVKNSNLVGRSTSKPEVQQTA